LTYAAYKSAGVTLGRTTFQQILNGSDIDKVHLAIGDLVFPDAGHVQIYSGGGNVVEAPHTGANVREVPMWGFWRARRIVPGGGSGSPATTVGLVQPVSSGISTVDQFVEAMQTGKDFFNLIGDKGTYVRGGLIVTGSISILVGLSLLGAVSVPGINHATTYVRKAAKL
jgi:hypothetical protein